MKEVASRWVDGRWSQARFARMNDLEVMEAIEGIKGLGPWSAMSVLIFGLMRPDVFPLSDFGVRQALVNLYFPLMFGRRIEPSPLGFYGVPLKIRLPTKRVNNGKASFFRL